MLSMLGIRLGTILTMTLLMITLPPNNVITCTRGEHTPNTIVYLVPHSHWDPDYMKTFNEYSVTVNDIIKSVLALMDSDPPFKYVMCETIFIKNFWEKYPELRSKLLGYVREGRIEIVGGAWVQPDTNLVCAESLIRDMLIGVKWVEKALGVRPQCAWQIDTFGHAPTLPELLVGAGYKYVVFNRISNYTMSFLESERAIDFWWAGPSGVTILAHWMRGSYGLGEYIPSEKVKAFETIKSIIDILKPYSPTKYIMIPVGSDFTYPKKYLSNTVNAWNEEMYNETDVLLTIGTASDYFKSVESEGAILPSLSIDPNPPIDPHVDSSIPYEHTINPPWFGFYSSRPLLKSLNRIIESRLFTIESVSTLNVLHGIGYPYNELSHIWELLSANHHHDSITGTSLDDVVEESILPRYLEAEILSNSLLTSVLDDLAGLVDTDVEGIPMIVYNPVPWERKSIMSVRINLSEVGAKYLAVKDADDFLIPSQMSNDGELAFVGNVPPLGYNVYQVIPLVTEPVYNTQVKAQGCTIENSYYRITIDNKTGCIEVYDKTLGAPVITNGNDIVYYNDAAGGMGMYIFVPNGTLFAANDLKNVTVEIVEDGPVRAEIRCMVQYKDVNITREVMLYDEIDRIDFTNRLKALPATTASVRLPTTIVNGEAYYLIPYGYIKRPLIDITPPEFYPTTYGVHYSDEKFGVTLAVIGSHGCRVTTDGTLEFMTVRSTQTQGSVGPRVLTDFDYHQFNYTIKVSRGSKSLLESFMLALEFNMPPVSMITSKHKGMSPKTYSLVDIESESTIVTAMKLASNGEEIILRLFNTCNESDEAIIKLPFAVDEATVVDLLERDVGSIGVEGNELRVDLPPLGVITISIKPAVDTSIELREVPFWVQWWFWLMVAIGTSVLAGVFYFLKKRKPQTSTAPPPPDEDEQ